MTCHLLTACIASPLQIHLFQTTMPVRGKLTYCAMRCPLSTSTKGISVMPPLVAMTLLFAGCGDAGADGNQSVVVEFEDVVVTGDVPSRVTEPDTRLVTFTAENLSTDQVQVWIEVAVDGIDLGCEIANVQNWSAVEAQANDPMSERFPLYRLRPGESIKAATSTVVSSDCLGGSLEVVIVVGSADPSGAFASSRGSVAIG